MPAPSNSTYPLPRSATHCIGERGIEDAFIDKLRSLKYAYRPDINDRATLEANFRDLVKIQKTIQSATAKHNQFLKELGLPLLLSE